MKAEGYIAVQAIVESAWIGYCWCFGCRMFRRLYCPKRERKYARQQADARQAFIRDKHPAMLSDNPDG